MGQWSSRQFICKKELCNLYLIASLTASKHSDLECGSLGPPIINCVKLASLKENSKLLLELLHVQHRLDFAPNIKHTSY